MHRFARVVRIVHRQALSLLEEFQERDSGWALSHILNLTVNANKHIPLRAGCHIKFPREIMLKRAVIHVQTADNACFSWSMLPLYTRLKNMWNENSSIRIIHWF